MITLRKHHQRHHLQHGRRETWQTFFAAAGAAAGDDAFGALVGLDEVRLPPGDSTESYLGDEAELVTYVHQGALSQVDSAGSSGVVHAGEFQHMSAGSRVRHRETSVSRSDWLHMFRISLRAAQLGLACRHEQMHFTAAQRRNQLCVVASADGRQGSLRIHQDVLVCSAILEPGYHLVHALAPDRAAWLHVVGGAATLDDQLLGRGDGAGVVDERAVAITVQEHAEILLIDLGPSCPRPGVQAPASSPRPDAGPAGPDAAAQPGGGVAARGARR